MPSTHISFSEQHICESKLAVGVWERSLLSHIKILIAFYYTLICRKLLYKSSFRGHCSNLVSSLTSYIKENLRWTENNKKKDCEVFNVLNTKQQQSHKLELNKFKLLFFGPFYISWNHAWPASQHDLGNTNKRLSPTYTIRSFIEYIVKYCIDHYWLTSQRKFHSLLLWS